MYTYIYSNIYIFESFIATWCHYSELSCNFKWIHTNSCIGYCRRKQQVDLLMGIVLDYSSKGQLHITPRAAIPLIVLWFA